MLILFAQRMMGLVSTQRRSSCGQPWDDEEICMSSYEVCRHQQLDGARSRCIKLSQWQPMRGRRHYHLTNQKPRNSLMITVMNTSLSPVKVETGNIFIKKQYLTFINFSWRCRWCEINKIPAASLQCCKSQDRDKLCQFSQRCVVRAQLRWNPARRPEKGKVCVTWIIHTK